MYGVTPCSFDNFNFSGNNIMRRYGIFRVVDDKLYGFVENSFSMGWNENFVRVWNKEELQCYLRKKYVGSYYNKVYDGYNIFGKYPDAFVVRLNNNHPGTFKKKMNKTVEILWDERTKILKRTDEEQKKEYFSKKYHGRNVGFKII